MISDAEKKMLCVFAGALVGSLLIGFTSYEGKEYNKTGQLYASRNV